MGTKGRKGWIWGSVRRGISIPGAFLSSKLIKLELEVISSVNLMPGITAGSPNGTHSGSS